MTKPAPMKLETSTGVCVSVERYNDLLEGEKGLWQTLKAHGKLVAALMKIRDGYTKPYGPERRAFEVQELCRIAADALAADLNDIDWSAFRRANEGDSERSQTSPDSES